MTDRLKMERQGWNVNERECVCFLPVESLKQVFGVDSESLFILVSSLSRITKNTE